MHIKNKILSQSNQFKHYKEKSEKLSKENKSLKDKIEKLSIEKGRDYVTLVTCTPYGVNSHRLLVRGIRTPYDESKDIPVYQVTDIKSFWTKLPAQYRHMLIGAGVIVVFLVFWILVRFLIAKKNKKKVSEFQ